MAAMQETTDPLAAACEKARVRFPFIFGAQYYRAPTPEPGCWADDLRHMRELGFNAVKFFVQWRWSHRRDDKFYFDDLDELLELAGANGLDVTLNILLDMSPTWLYRAFPDARQVDAGGHIVEPYAVSHRSIGGHPVRAIAIQGPWRRASISWPPLLRIFATIPPCPCGMSGMNRSYRFSSVHPISVPWSVTARIAMRGFCSGCRRNISAWSS